MGNIFNFITDIYQCVVENVTFHSTYIYVGGGFMEGTLSEYDMKTKSYDDLRLVQVVFV